MVDLYLLFLRWSVLRFRENGMDISLFKRLSECHPHAVVQLEYQYRMHKDIMLLSNTLIYENRLKCATREISESFLDLPDLGRLRDDVSRLEERGKGIVKYLCLDNNFLCTISLP